MTSGPGPMPRSCIILRTDWVKKGAAKVPGPLLVGSGSDCRSWALRHRDMVEDAPQDIVGEEAFGVGFVLPRQSRSAQILTAGSVQQQPIAAPEGSEINHGVHRNNTEKRIRINCASFSRTKLRGRSFMPPSTSAMG